jgi:RHS repeat-associated core domain
VVINQSGTVQQVNHYYPFGGLFGEGLQDSNQPYKYNGKELDRQLGLDMYDYGARHYDAALARWFTVDPLAEKYPHLSGYVYCFNNPINYFDPDGQQGRRSAASGAFIGWLIPPARATTPLQMMQKDRLHIKAVHAVLDVGGMAPGVGEPADALNGLLYSIEGDTWNAGMSFAGTIPLLGWAANECKMGLKRVKKCVKG